MADNPNRDPGMSDIVKLNLTRWVAIISVMGGLTAAGSFLFAIPNKVANLETDVSNLKNKSEKAENQVSKIEILLGRIDEKITAIKEEQQRQKNQNGK